MGAVFVSYRREDSEGQARALFNELAHLIGKDSVFMDVDSIALGRDFRQIIQERLETCDLLLVLIGPDWLDAKDDAGNRRLESPTDFVRQEIAAALKRNISVTPVFLRGAQMPEPEHLPDDLKDLAYRSGFELSHTRWESDIQEMLRRLGLAKREDSQESRHSVTVTTEAGKHVVTGIGQTADTVEDKPSKRWSRKWVAMLSTVALSLFGVVVYVLWPAPLARMSDMEYGTNRFGGDYRSFEASQPQVCSDTCAREPQCLAFSFVKPGVQGKTAVCWLKDQVVPPRSDACCISGIKNQPH